MKNYIKTIGIGIAATLTLGWSGATASTAVTFKSNQEGTIKVCTYNTTDAVQAIPLKVFKINPGKSATWTGPPSKFHVKVFKPQLIDQLLCSKNNVASSSTVTIGKDESINVKAKAPLVFHNSSSQTMKFAVYKSSDRAMLVPYKTWTIKKGKKVTWKSAPGKFHLKVFKPQLIDKLVVTKKNIPDRKTVKLTGKGSKFKVSI